MALLICYAIYTGWTYDYTTSLESLIVKEALVLSHSILYIILYNILNRDNQRLAKIINSKVMYDRETTHEMRHPLNIIYGLCEALVHPKCDADTREKLIPLIHKSSELLRAYLEYALQFPKFDDEEKIAQDLKSFNLHECLENIILILTKRDYAIDIKLELSLDNEVPHTIYSNRTVIIQIVMNQLSNGIKFSKNRFDSVKLHAKTNNDILILTVEDQGKGINKVMIDRIFDPFVTTSNPHQECSGIGLSLTKKHVKRLGGTIKVDSALDIGTTFIITLPLKNDEIK
ncbi:sensor histidine kinase [Chitinophaga sancti]|uniref:histidine kinase n=1 Tax=Chitinophaga sancti TaxID=1004 RepID=A0A1K1S3A3_9BACT|nr:HAMP domain-containing sensor histidine kinase [Chitinophaga sancti]WQD63787.1 HAMP domain-containing sensor histidine kinase [Chitinophaga sancti]WQG90588.1 HAMP domain-containing sensor histidine kinase [Chitinophaga sancti]SFW78851.1 Histidine kinase-, DNA gyrase B-, and HSP90-like ATPase [Chitinophaga sancti]